MKFNEYKLSELLNGVIDNRGKNPERYFEKEEYPVIDNYLIKNTFYPNMQDVNRYIDKATFDNFLRGYVKKDMVIMTLVGNGIGNVTLCPSEKVAIIQNTIGFDVKEELLDNYYLYYYFIKESKTLKGFDRGSGQPSIKKTDVLNMSIKVPSINEQKQIVKSLSTIDKQIEEYKETKICLQNIINEYFKEWFVNYNYPESDHQYKETELGLIPNDWSIKKLSDVADFSNGYGLDTKIMLDSPSADTIKVFKMGNIKPGGGIIKEKTKSWIKLENIPDSLNKYFSKKGDILMCMTDMKNSDTPLLGHSSLIDKDNEFIINQRVGIIRVKDDVMNYQYLYTLSNTSNFVESLRSRANSGVQVNLSTKGICDTLLVCPSKSVLDEFKKIVSPFYEEMFEIESLIENYSNLRDIILPKIMNDYE